MNWNELAHNTSSLEDLMDLLKTAHEEGVEERQLDWTELPTFGGMAPDDTSAIWSWSPTHILTGLCADELSIKEREDVPLLGIRKLATICALDAIELGGSSPTDADGNIILPTEPLGGDWNDLALELNRAPNDEERAVFAAAYGDTMTKEIMRLNAVASIRRVIENSGLTYTAVAAHAGWTRGQLDQRLRAKSPSLDTLLGIAGALGITVSELIGE
jgi:DNA-binding phage protein